MTSDQNSIHLTLRSSAARDSSSNLAVAMSRFDFMERHLQSPIQVRERGQLLFATSGKPLAVVAVCISNPDRGPARIQS